jgi:hypothetical protein
MANDPQSSVENFVGSALQQGEVAINNGLNKATTAVTNAISDTGFGKALRAVGLLPGAVPTTGVAFTDANWGSQTDLDWRVRLSVPQTYKSSPLLTPLLETGGFMFPYTPQILVQHSAHYNSLAPTHSNYPFPHYQNSQIDSMTIIGEFFVENELEGQYWIAAVHYLRSITKMAYGASSNQGSPPPVVKLNGYGDYVFKNVPVVVQMFSVDLPNDVDYIQVGLGENGSWVPTRSQISVVVQPAYSRNSISDFSLDAFVNGSYVVNGKGFI